MKLYTYSGKYENGCGFWIPIKDVGLLYQVKSEGDIQLVCEFKNGKRPNSSDITKIVTTDEYIFFFSRVGYELWRLNRNDYTVDHFEYCSAQMDAIFSIVPVGHYVYVFPNLINNIDSDIICLDLTTLKVHKVPVQCSEFNCSTHITLPKYYNGKIYFATRTPSEIKIIELNCKSYIIKSCEIKNAKYIDCIEIFDEKIYALIRTSDKKTLLCQYNLKGSLQNSYDLSQYLVYEDNIRISVLGMVKKENKLLLVHTFLDRVDVITLIDDDFTYSIIEGDNKIQSRDRIVHNDIQKFEDHIYIYSPSYGTIEKYDWHENNLIEIELFVSDDNIPDDILVKRELVFETEVLSLEEFLREIQ